MASILISTGEASGDSIGAALVCEMNKLGFHGEKFAVGGKRLKDSGCNILCDSSKWGAIGIFQSIKVAPKIMNDYYRLKAWLRNNKPELVIAIDFGYVNIKLCRYAKSLGCKTLYFMPPGSWRRNKQGADLPAIADRIATPFSWSADILKEMGANVEWVGHPIYQMAQEGDDTSHKFIAVLPGSREHEIANNLNVIATAIDKTELPKGLTPVIVAAPNVSADFLESEWKKHSKVPVIVPSQLAVSVLKQSLAAVICSGTATLEAAICNCPMVVVYRVDKIMELEYRIRKPKFDFIALPSIILQKKVVPELIHYDATPETIASELSLLMSETVQRRCQIESFEQIRDLLGPKNGITRTAQIALEMLNK